MFRIASIAAILLFTLATTFVPTALATPGEAVTETFYAAAHLAEVYMDAADDAGASMWPDAYSPNGGHIGPFPVNTTEILTTQLRAMGQSGRTIDALLHGIP